MKYLTLLVILFLSLILLCFLYLNQGLVTITYYPGGGHQTPPVPLFAVIMLAVIAGVLMAGMIGFAEQLRLRFRLRQAQRASARLEKRLQDLGFGPEEEQAVAPTQEVLPEVVEPVKLPDQPV
jgi:uncharacterized integral membrane protein